jgi:hypothetical protein
MNRREREERREAAEAEKEHRKSERERRKKAERKAERAVRKALAKLRGPNVKRLMDFLSGDLDLSGLGREYHLTIIPVVAHSSKKQQQAFKDLMNEVLIKAPRIAEERHWPAYYTLAGMYWLRPVTEWNPRGKSRATIFRSLVDHLLIEYPVPGFLYSVFAVNPMRDRNARALAHFLRYVGQGGSPYNYMRSAFLPLVMTRRMCHEFMHTPGDMSFYQAARRAQAVVLGGDRGVIKAICRSRLGRGFGKDERFWLTVIKWFCETEGLDLDRVGPLVDFIANRKRADSSYSMKGRTINSMLRAMEAWHRELSRARKVENIAFRKSGIPGGTWTSPAKTRRGQPTTVTWDIREILTSQELAAEGREMHHCVYSYANWVKERAVSIWSLRRDRERLLTVEVRNQNREIVQARGSFNRRATSPEINKLKHWASESGLKLRVR